ncbi:MAG TPA: ATP-binding protein, partial [Armatimonadota bacterium]|nr:ATP-binding protein [Armatimonadota bacterium]
KEFVANVSHELRTPITAVRVTAEALLSGAKDDPQLLDRFLTTLVKESERLSLLIDDLLEIAKREAGQRKIRRTEIDLPRLMTRIIALHRAKAEASNIGITSEVQDDLTIYADEQQIEQVISNLLDNAIKYTLQNGKVDVRAEGNGKSVTISVTDTGIGIPNNEVPRIFERFYRVDKARSRQLGGTGLGLSIVKDIVEAHNGTITVETELGSGSTFTVSIPRNNAGNDEDEDQDHSSAV